MDATQLLAIVKTQLYHKDVQRLATVVHEQGMELMELIDLSLHPNVQVGFRAAWILENVYSAHTEAFIPVAPYFLDKFSAQNNLSARRHFAKILAFITHHKAAQALQQIIASYDTSALVDTVFSWVIAPEVPVAVKSQCLNVLGNLSSKHSWIKEELLETMEFLVDKESIAFHAKVKQIRKQLSVKRKLMK